VISHLQLVCELHEQFICDLLVHLCGTGGAD
jgi:hypothetical protein